MARKPKKTEEKPKNKGGRPKTELPWEKIYTMMQVGCTKAEIMYMIDTNERTFDRHCKELHNEGFAGLFNKYFSNTKMSLRRKQLECAFKGSSGMLIWLGKQYLGQVDMQYTTDQEPRVFKLAYDPDFSADTPEFLKERDEHGEKFKGKKGK